MISVNEQELDEVFYESICTYTGLSSAELTFPLGKDNLSEYISLSVAIQYHLGMQKFTIHSIKPTEKALRYLYKLVGEDYDNHR